MYQLMIDPIIHFGFQTNVVGLAFLKIVLRQLLNKRNNKQMLDLIELIHLLKLGWICLLSSWF